MSGQARNHASSATRLVALLAYCLSILMPLAASGAQVPEASPVVDPTATPSPEATTEPTATAEPSVTPTASVEASVTPEPTPTEASDFSAAAYGSISFDAGSYTIIEGSPRVATLKVNFDGLMQVEGI